MKVAGNKLAHLSDFYHEELDPVVGKEETSAIFRNVCEHFLKIKGSELQSRLEENINQSDLLSIYDTCKELKTGRPLQYILREAWFYGLNFFVNEKVLIPRPETEELCDMVIKENAAAYSFLDIGTGSGCIAVCVKKNLPAAAVSACDVSADALAVAKKNARRHDTSIEFFLDDILDKNGVTGGGGNKYDVIISNPPYILKEESNSLAEQVTGHEPHLALFVNGQDGIIFYRRIIELCEKTLSPGGRLYFELNPLTAVSVRDYAQSSGIFTSVSLVKDMTGNVRFMRGER